MEMEKIIEWSFLNGTIRPKTIIMTWVVLTILSVFVILGTRKMTSGKPGKYQNVLEWIVDFIKARVAENMDYKKAAGLLSYLVTLIMFVFFANLLGLIPNIFAPIFGGIPFANYDGIHFAQLNEMFGHANLMSPTADVNVTMGLALLSFILIFAMGIKAQRGRFFKHFLEPTPPFLVMHIIDYVAKPVTMAFRLFGNIYAGEILIIVILAMPANMLLAGALGGAPLMAAWMAFSIFIGAIQSFIFTVLTIAFVGQAVSSDH
jgi:F-type H+-transporting ATPase subunit a